MYPYPNMTVIYPLYHSLCYNLTANTYRLMPASNPLFRCIGSLYWSHDIFSFFPYTIRSGTISISIAWIWWDTVSWKVVYRTIKRYCFIIITTIYFYFFPPFFALLLLLLIIIWLFHHIYSLHASSVMIIMNYFFFCFKAMDLPH